MPIVAVNDAIFELALNQLFVMEESGAVAWHCERIRECLPNLPHRTMIYLLDKLKHRKANPSWSANHSLQNLQEYIEATIKGERQ